MSCKTTSGMLQVSVPLILLNLALCGNTQAGRVAFYVVPVSPLEGETLELNCQCQYYYWWTKQDFTFYRNGKKIHSMKSTTDESSYHIKVKSTNDSGLYSCKIDGSESQHVHVQVQERFAKPVLRVEPAAEVFEGLRVTLTCIARRARRSIWLHYTFYRDGSALETAPDAGGVYTINAAAANVSGNYACEAIETNSDLRKRSDNVHLSVREAFAVPKLTVYPEGQLVDGQWFKLMCLVEENLSEASLRYGFYRNGIPIQSPSDHSNSIPEPARLADSGTYHCEVMGSKVRKRSNQLHLSIRRIPVSKPELVIQSGKELIEGDMASLICSVSNGSLPIYYQFYKGSSVELYWELSNSTKLVYNIETISRKDKGIYHCSVRNEVTGPLHSEDIEITVIVPVSDAVLIPRTNGTEIQPGDRLVLRCLVREGTEPQFIWYRDNVPLRNGSASSHVTADGGELVIHSFRRDSVGRYHCAAINTGTDGTIFNVTSDYIEFTLRGNSDSQIRHRQSTGKGHSLHPVRASQKQLTISVRKVT
ncbi:Fc receptor-like protein 3 isoform X1 [Stegostoma tigrinum]|uniref:Fc receptor-like protein 3 isoform X1 n=1 Tax=Stegostoma tigrinum TaxID=3053191 RepID=UPI00286FE06C|nr:Fc receptor-like protein 3 isoform X1 [Stegostoma tigrinum]XP_059498059.1 Fc receptor-like protein 3 isoform X1 [Stegostoma tigrinum]XP_059498060.1 Fc receptor-like protein 3 isoform X1 [Stegostoma tigrinum]